MAQREKSLADGEEPRLQFITIFCFRADALSDGSPKVMTTGYMHVKGAKPARRIVRKVSCLPSDDKRHHDNDNVEYSDALFLVFYDPGRSFIQLGMIEVQDLGSRKWLAKHGHALFPLRFTNDGQPLDVVPMLEAEFEVFPQRPRSPTVEIMHLEQDTNLTMFLNLFVHNRYKHLVRLLRQFARHSYV
jgi:hypothetical protein